jgi:hypothetical protein
MMREEQIHMICIYVHHIVKHLWRWDGIFTFDSPICLSLFLHTLPARVANQHQIDWFTQAA